MPGRPAGAVDARQHAFYLVIAMVVLAVFGDELRVLAFGQFGLLHSIAFVLALKLDGQLGKRAVFVALATGLSALAPQAGALLLKALGDGDVGAWRFVALLYGGASATGAALYWGLVRLCWLRHLPPVSLLTTIALCVLATLGTVTVLGNSAAGAGRQAADVIAVALWWAAFSWSVVAGSRRAP